MGFSVVDLFLPVFYFFLLGFSSPGEVGLVFFAFSLGIVFLISCFKFFWFGLLVWMTYISALLVLFLFFISLVSTSKFNFSVWTKMVALLMLLFFSLSLFSSGSFSFMEVQNDSDLGLSCFYVWGRSKSGLCLVLSLFLLLCMLVVSQIVGRGKSCLRYI